MSDVNQKKTLKMLVTYEINGDIKKVSDLSLNLKSERMFIEKKYVNNFIKHLALKSNFQFHKQILAFKKPKLVFIISILEC